MPDGRNLAKILLEKPKEATVSHPLDRVAGHVVKSKGVDHVYTLLKSTLTVSKVDPKLNTLYTIPWRRIYTTNYDNAIEVSREGRVSSKSFTLSDESTKCHPGSIIHLNGYIKYVSPANLQNGLILTDVSYAASRLADSEWLRFFLRDLRSARAVIFVGYSLGDLDIQRVLMSEPTLARKTFFFISPDADELETGAIEEYGSLVGGGIDVLISEIGKTLADYDAVRLPLGFMSLSELRVAADDEIFSTAAQKLNDQLVYGKFPEREILLGSTVFENQPFLINRKQDRNAADAFYRGPYRDFLFIGELASGKTGGVLNLCYLLIKEGFRVFYARKSSSLADELARIAKWPEKVAIVFENYYYVMDEIREYVASRHVEHRIILTERTVTHELVSDFVDRTKHLGPIFEASYDVIDRSDIAGFEALVNFGGFWGERAGAPEASRQAIISGQLGGSLYKLLVEIINSEKVQSEIKRLVHPLQNDRPAMKLFVSAFIINVMDIQFSINEWQSVFDGAWVRQVMRTYQEQVRNFLTLSGDYIFPRSGVISAYVLRNFADDDIVRESLVDLYERSMRDSWSDPELDDLRIKLTRYGSIEPIFSSKNKSVNIFRYYDEIRVFGGTRNNADYWLQVGIAATIHDDLPRAEKAFENAYSRERIKRNPNLKKIDNYFSRFQMRKAIEETDHQEAFNTFIKAAERLKKQIFLESNRHYPFKTGRHYSDIAAKHYSKWSEIQKQKFIRETKEIHDKAIEWRVKNNEANPDVEILVRETTKLLLKIDIQGNEDD